MVQINVAHLLKQPVGTSYSYEINAINDLGNEAGDCWVQGEVELIRIDRGILAKGILGTAAHLICSRCLIRFDHPLELNIEAEFFPALDVTNGASLPLPEGSTGFVIDEHHILDLSEVVRQYVLLSTPMKPLCHPECAGLCPCCGADLNQGPCGCASTPDSSLKKLFSIWR